MKYKVYGLFHPVSGELRYVGATRQSLQHRLKSHVVLANSQRRIVKSHALNWVKSLGRDQPIIELIQSFNSENDMLEAELYWIEHFRALGCRLTNATTIRPYAAKQNDKISHRSKSIFTIEQRERFKANGKRLSLVRKKKRKATIYKLQLSEEKIKTIKEDCSVDNSVVLLKEHGGIFTRANRKKNDVSP